METECTADRSKASLRVLESVKFHWDLHGIGELSSRPLQQPSACSRLTGAKTLFDDTKDYMQRCKLWICKHTRNLHYLFGIGQIYGTKMYF